MATNAEQSRRWYRDMRNYERHLGPWTRTDMASDVFADIRTLDPETVQTESSTRAYLRMRTAV